MSNEHSYERLCDYYKAKQKEKDMMHSKAKYNVGDRKEVIRFALFPIIVQSEIIWLKKYIAVKEYKELIEWDEFAHEYYKTRYWETIKLKRRR